MGPVTAAGLAEVAGLREVVVVVVTELGVGGFTTWARKLLLFSCRVLGGDPLVAAAAAVVVVVDVIFIGVCRHLLLIFLVSVKEEELWNGFCFWCYVEEMLEGMK